MPELHAYEVGKPFVEGRADWPEALFYNYVSGEHGLTVFWRNVGPREVRAFHQGPWRFGIYHEPPVLLFLARCEGTMPWSDAPFEQPYGEWKSSDCASDTPPGWANS